MGLERFMACLLSRKKVEAYINKHLKIIKRTPYGNKRDEAFYWLYVMKKK